MAASSVDGKRQPRPFTSSVTSADAAQVRQTLERKQKCQADNNLMMLRCMIETSHIQESSLASTTELEHPNWEHYDPLDISEHIYRYAVPSKCLSIMHMITVTYTNVAQLVTRSIKAKTLDGLSPAAWMQTVADVSCGALTSSEQYWNFTVPAYKELKFTAYQLLFHDVSTAKLFVIIVNDIMPYDFFFYYF